MCIHIFIWYHFFFCKKISCRMGLLVINYLHFCMTIKVFVLHSFVKYFYWHRILSWKKIFFFQYLKDVAVLSSCVHGFWQEICHHSWLFSYVTALIFLSECFLWIRNLGIYGLFYSVLWVLTRFQDFIFGTTNPLLSVFLCGITQTLLFH